MKKLLSVFAGILFTGAVHAQTSWQLVLHKKNLLIGKEVSEEKNVKLLRSSDWKKNGYLEINYREEQPSSWIHNLKFLDENEQEILSKDSTLSTRINTKTLRSLFAGKKEIKIYMMILPPDPMMAAPARRIHLATLKLPK